MKKFLGEDFLLPNETAQILFDNYAKDAPIYDFHCHISPREICEDRHYSTITEVWLGGDHYKWRLMRACGVDEKFITGNAGDREKFRSWAECLSRAPGNPLYHWSHLELKRYFGFDGVLSAETADEVFDLCNKRLADPDMGVRGIIARSNVKVICTTDDPIDSLDHHFVIAADENFSTAVYPTWRPDKSVNIDKGGFAEYIAVLGDTEDTTINSTEDLFSVLTARMDHFATLGCRAADHGLDYVPYVPATSDEVDRIFADALAGKPISKTDADKYKTALLVFFAAEYHRRGWVMQLHYGAIRNANPVMFRALGPDSGFDSISTDTCINELAKLLGQLEKDGHLPGTIIYPLNGADNAAVAALCGCFPETGKRTRVQLGSAWWFCDTRSGMETQLTSLAELNALGNFVGMLTDSRSFLSYTRHEYFRRILCGLIGRWVENGELPNDIPLLGGLIRDISCNNAERFFGF